MSKQSITFILAFWTLSSTFLFSQQTKTIDTESTYKYITILDKGVKRKIRIYEDDISNKSSISFESKQTNSQKGIIVSFKNPSEVSVDGFADKYSLKFKKKLATGYYIFTNMSQKSDIDIVESIIINETYVKTVKPNWNKQNRVR